ncbi:STXA protein, partial [Polypterus senegalus]
MMTARGDECLERPTFGQFFRLGMLYDCCLETTNSGITLWDSETLNSHTKTEARPDTTFQLISSSSFKAKAKGLAIGHPLRASLSSGLIPLKDSFAYLNINEQSSNKVCVGLLVQISSKYKKLRMTELKKVKVTNPDISDQAKVTHVVTAVLYGIQVFVKFEIFDPSSDEKDNLQCKLEWLIRSKLVLKRGHDVHLTDMESEVSKRLQCTFFSDFHSSNDLVNFEEACDIISTLPDLLGENRKNAVPMKVWLQPVSYVDSKASPIVHEVPVSLVESLQAALDHLDNFTTWCSEALKDEVSLKFTAFKKRFQKLQSLCMEYKSSFQTRLSKTIPSVRRGEKSENAIVEILKEHDQSPFGPVSLKACLDDKEKEMAVIRSYLKMLAGFKVVSSASQFDSEILDPEAEHVICFMITSLKEKEPYLSDMSSYLNSLINGTPASQELIDYEYEKRAGKRWFKMSSVSKKMRSTARHFVEFAKTNAATGQVKFIVASCEDVDHAGASIYCYDDGNLENTNFELPSKPDPPQIVETSQDQVTVKLNLPSQGATHVDKLRLEYKEDKDSNWSIKDFSSREESFCVKDLIPNIKYQFRYAVICKVGISSVSDITEATTMASISDSRNTSEMKQPTENLIPQKESSPPAWPSPDSKRDEHQSGVPKAQDKEGDRSGKPKPNSYDNTTPAQPQSRNKQRNQEGKQQRRLALNVRDKMSRKNKSNAQKGLKISLHNLKLSEENLNKDGNCRRVTFGHTSNKMNKTIMMIGATGAGKTTLINGMINYILGVEWEDDFRFVLIDEKTQKSQAESQTSAVTAYEINYMEGFSVPYSLTIVDTPGFGDTRGIKHDQRITGLIHDFFSQPGGIDHIDAVCFVTQASLARLTHTQRYIFDSILSIFGKDIADNIVMLVTFADGQKPPVLEAIKASQIPCSVNRNGEPMYFKFNNSALFVDNSKPKWTNEDEFESDNFDHMFWKMGTYSLRHFFKSLKSFSPKSLSLTQEVLKERQELEVAIEGLQPQINAGLTTLDEIRKIKNALEQHKAEMEANKDFEYEFDATEPVQEENTSGMYLTNCQRCHFTCHDSCAYADDKDKHKCCAMDKKGYCKVCPGNCAWNDHFNQKYKWTYVTTKKKGTYNELKQRFEEAHGEVMTTEKIFKKLEFEFFIVQDIVFGLIQKSHQCLEKLKVIALRPNPLSAPDYIDLMIESEKRECKPGFQDRIQSLMEVRQKAEIVSKMSSGDLLPEEWRKYEKKQVTIKSVFGNVMDWVFRYVPIRQHLSSTQSSPEPLDFDNNPTDVKLCPLNPTQGLQQDTPMAPPVPQKNKNKKHYAQINA